MGWGWGLSTGLVCELPVEEGPKLMSDIKHTQLGL